MRHTNRLSTRTDTSDSAFAAAPKGAAADILAALRDRPRSVDELMFDLDMSHSTASAAVNKLMRLGWVFDDGVRTITRNGRVAIVWIPRDIPVPIRDSAPTRAELLSRIVHAIQTIDRNHSDMRHLRRILTGEFRP